MAKYKLKSEDYPIIGMWIVVGIIIAYNWTSSPTLNYYNLLGKIAVGIFLPLGVLLVFTLKLKPGLLEESVAE